MDLQNLDGTTKQKDKTNDKTRWEVPTSHMLNPDAIEQDDLEQWKDYCEKVYKMISRQFDGYGYYYDLSTEFINPFYAASHSWPLVKRQLYHLFALCFIISKTFEEMRPDNPPTASHYRTNLAGRLAQECFREVTNLYAGIESSNSAQSWLDDKIFWEIAAYLRTAILESQYFNEAIVLTYELLWMHVAHLSGGIDNEIRQFADALSTVKEDSPRPLTAHSALVCLLILSGRDDEARRFAQFASEASESLILMLMWVASTGAWRRLVDWLRFVTDDIHRFHPEDIRRLANLWLDALPHLPAEEEACEGFLKKTLPVTEKQYEQYLLQSNQMRRWVELQMLNQVEPYQYRADFLKIIEKADREVLLPWYHQAIDRAVRQKNRKSYKVAVRLLKKLATHYKKLKQPDNWNRFITGFTSRHSRLRALQEEMRKKGLIL